MNVRVLVVCAGLLLLPALGAGQSVDVVLKGVVTDESGAALPGATVTATNLETGLVRSATADPSGHYILLNLPAGTYDVRAELTGLAPQVRRAQTFYVGTTITLDFTLKVPGVAERVEVRGNAPVLEASKHTLARVVQRDEIDALPVINRNFNDLAALAPGVTRTGVYGGVDISGSRDFQNASQVDGVSSERHTLGDQRIRYSQDWIQEFQVMTGQFAAEFGQAAGGVLNVITRSGGNQLAGRVYGFFRDDRWDAMPQFATRKPPLSQQRIGGTVGGPVIKDRLFYFGGVEWFNIDSSNIVNSTFGSANGTFPFSVEEKLYLAKLELVANAAHTIRFRHNGQREDISGSSIGGINTEEHGRFSKLRANDFIGSWTWVMSPTRLNELRAAWNTYYPQGGCNFATRNPPGTWFERLYPGALFGCPVNFGTIAEDQAQLVENLSWIRGRHELKLGVQTYWTRSFGDFRNFRDGRYSFERDLPFSLSNPDSYPFFFTIIQGPTAWDVWGWSSGVFAQDSWRLTNDVTLSVGVRYDVDGSLTALNPLVRVDQGLHPIEKDLNNAAPRAGFAWTPFKNEKRTLIRGGAGVYYDQNHSNVAALTLFTNILVDRTLTINANNPLLNPFWPDIARAKRFLAEAFVRNTIPDLTGLGPVVGGTFDVDHDLQIPATTQVSSGIAHDFRHGLNASADVVYARGVDLNIVRDINVDPVTFQRVNPNYSSIASFGNGGSSTYKALHAQANFTPAARHLVKVAYTLAKTRSNTDRTLSSGAATNPFDYSEDEGPADNDVRHAVSVNGSTVLPLEVQVSGLLSYRTALPYSASTNAPRPDGKPFGWRPEPRNARRADSALSLDLRLAKIVKLAGRRSATGFVEVFNLTNAVNFGGYIRTITSSRFGQPTTAGPKRRMQVGFRVDFSSA